VSSSRTSRLVADAGYGSAEMIGWLVDERGIEPHFKLDKSERTDGTFSRSDFVFDTEGNLYVCPTGKELKKYHRSFPKRDGLTKDGTMIYFARKQDCHTCALKPQCCPNVPARKIARSVHEAARDKARTIAKTAAYAVSCRERKKVEMLFAHLKRSSGSVDCASVARAAPRTSSYWPPPPKSAETGEIISFPEPAFAL
jgi:radical SAM protein with 4Fe4S-binding SPASM domain